MINLEDVRVFIELAAQLSFTRTATKLRLSKSRVARHLARLEGEVGTALLSRTTRVVQLTESGRAFLPHARRLIDDSVEAEKILNGAHKSLVGLLTVTAPSTFGRAFLAPRLPAFRVKYPGVRIVLKLTSTKLEVGGGLVDVAIRLGPLIERNLGNRELGKFESWLVAAPDYLSRRRALRHPTDLARHDIIELRPPAVDGRIELRNAQESVSINCVSAIEIDDPSAVLAAAVGGGGIAILPAFLAAPEIHKGGLARVLPDWSPPPTPISVVYSAASALPSRVQVFIEFILETLAREKPWVC